MTSALKVVNESLLNVLGDQPNVGFSVFGHSGDILYCNVACRRLFYGTTAFDPVGMNVADIEGDEFSAELLPLIKQVCETRTAMQIAHVRFGRRISSVGWPIRTSTDVPPDVADATLGLSTLCRTEDITHLPGAIQIQSKIASWGVLERLTDRELEVLAEIGRGLSQQEIADELGITRKTVETHRARIGQKLNAKSSNELARIACESGLKRSDVALKRQRVQRWMELAELAITPQPAKSGPRQSPPDPSGGSPPSAPLP